jgi:hypothetical protein
MARRLWSERSERRSPDRSAVSPQGSREYRSPIARPRMWSMLRPGPVDLPHHHGVTGAQLIHQGGKAGAVVPSARHGVRVDLRCTGRLERIVLLVQRLGDGADPGVTEPQADNPWADGL